MNDRETKFLVFREVLNPGKKTQIFAVSNKSTSHLGYILWRSGWRKYVFEPQGDLIFDALCLTDITNFLNDLMEERKEKTAAAPVESFKLLSSLPRKFVCDNCHNGIIKTVFNTFTDHHSCEIKKCDNCGYQYHTTDELFKLKKLAIDEPSN